MKEKSFWPERKSAIIESLERKINSVLSLRDRLQSLSAETPTGNFNEVIDDWWKELLIKLPPYISEKFARYQQLGSEIDSLYEKNFLPFDEKVDGLISEKEALDKETLYHMTFLETMSKVGENLKKKHAQVVQTEEYDLKQIVEIVEKKLGVEIVEVRRKVLSISLIIDREYSKKSKTLFRELKILGLSLNNTPFNLVVRGTKPEETDYTAEHEDIHGIFEAVGEPINLGLVDIFKNDLKNYKITAALSGSLEKENIRKIITKGLFNPKKYLDSHLLHSEMVAFLISTFHHFKLARPEDFLSLGYSLGHLSKLKDCINEEIKRSKASKNEGEKSLATRLEDFEKNLLERFLDITDTIDTILETLDLLRELHAYNPLIREKVEILFLILLPTQYNIIPKYLENKPDPENTKK